MILLLAFTGFYEVFQGCFKGLYKSFPGSLQCLSRFFKGSFKALPAVPGGLRWCYYSAAVFILQHLNTKNSKKFIAVSYAFHRFASFSDKLFCR